jgi:hypothetical protein
VNAADPSRGQPRTSSASDEDVAGDALPTVFVATPSNAAETSPPATGMAFPRLMSPFWPNLVRSRKPTARLIALIVSKETDCTAFSASFSPTRIPTPFRTSFAASPQRQTKARVRTRSS